MGFNNNTCTISDLDRSRLTDTAENADKFRIDASVESITYVNNMCCIYAYTLLMFRSKHKQHMYIARG